MGCAHLCFLLPLLSHLPAPVFLFCMGQGTEGLHSLFAVLKALLISTVSLLFATASPKPQLLFFSGFHSCFIGFYGSTSFHPKVQQSSCGIDIGVGLWEGYLCVDYLNMFLFLCSGNSSSS